MNNQKQVAIKGYGRNRVWSATAMGLKHEINQDRFLVEEPGPGGWLLAVADGIGGNAGGEVAAQMAIDRLKGYPGNLGEERSLIDLVRDTDREIRNRARETTSLEGMGTTLTVLYLEETTAFWVHVGDSRLYLFRDERLSQLTRDQTMARFLVEEAIIDPEEAHRHPSRHLLLDCLGCPECKPESGNLKLVKGDLLLLTTDGIHDYLDDEELGQVVTLSLPWPERLRGLIETARNAGSKDDATILVWGAGTS